MIKPFWFWGHLAGALVAGGLISLSNSVNFGGTVLGWVVASMIGVCVVGARRGLDAAVVASLTQLAVVGGCVALASVAPVKTVDRVLERRLVLPATSLTLGELRTYFGSPAGWKLATHVSITEEQAQLKRVIQWPDREVSVRQFIAAIEAQTPLRHHFGGCGNGSSILFGSNCVFGLRFSDARETR